VGQTTTRVGPALRSVRTQRGLTLDEAARDTRIRREFLEAIEREEFDRLLGEVHVRGCLRTYASYLRLSPDKVVAAYAPEPIDPIPTPLPGSLPREPALDRPRRRDNHRLIVLVAATVLVLAAAFGVLSARNSAPAPADLDTAAGATPGDAALVDRTISIGVVALDDLEATVTVDAAPPRTYQLEAGEGRSFEAQERLTIRLSDGGAAEVSVSGAEPEVPGDEGEPWEETYSFGDPSAP
jgi:transcriptional regulator with XRE-family HTH domain